MTIKTSTLRPGLLVSLKTTIRGNVSYSKQTLESDHIVDGQAKARWETERTINDPQEHESAKIARGKARSLITAVCSASAFGLLCPETAAEELERAIAAARLAADEFNATAKLSSVSVYVITGRIAPDDVEAVRAINSEIRDLLSDMEAGVRNLDVAVIREAANKARSLGAMLSPEAATRVAMAIDTARTAARKIVKAGEQAAQEIDLRAVRMIAEARTAFLDLDESAPVAAPTTEARAVDFESIAAPVAAPVAPAVPAMDLD